MRKGCWSRIMALRMVRNLRTLAPPVICLANQAGVVQCRCDGESLRVFRQYAWLGVDSGKTAVSRPAHQGVTLTIRRYSEFANQ